MSETYQNHVGDTSEMMGSQKGLLDQFILLGDSITQQSSCQNLGFAFQPALQDAFIRRLDVINRGFSGYNTSQCLYALPSFIPKPHQATIRFMTIFLGANDAVLPNTTGKDVSLPQYTLNLRRIIQHPSLHPHLHPSPNTHSDNPHPPPPTKLILITPPPICEYQLEADGRAPRRNAEHTKSYADACLEVGRELDVVVVDLWGEMMRMAGWAREREGVKGVVLVGSKGREKSEVLDELLEDGLHFNPAAYKVLFEATMKVIKDTWPEEDPQGANFDYVLPPWDKAPRAE